MQSMCLKKTPTEAFIEFSALHPQVKVKQWKFKSLKPFFVKQAKERDRKSCLCREHVETQIVFSACVKFKKAAMKNSAEGGLTIQVPATLSEAVDSTLCPKPEGASFQNIKCLQRECVEWICSLFFQRNLQMRGLYVGHGMTTFQQERFLPMVKKRRKSPSSRRKLLHG